METLNKAPLRVLLFEDNQPDYVITRHVLQEASKNSRLPNNTYDLVWAPYLRDGIERLQNERFDVIVLDMSLPDAVGLDGLHRCRAVAPETPIIILTGTDDESLAAQALQQGAQDYLVKGQPPESLPRSIRYAIERQYNLIELERAKAQALSAIEAKGMFLANMSHEIRTPLTAIIGFTETLLLPQSTNEERQWALNAVLRNGHHLLQVINDILDMSKVEAGNIEIESVACSPLQIVADVEDAIRLKATEKGIDFSVRCTTPMPESISTDPTRLRQILLNLVGNAIKFTPKGEVKLEVKWDQPNQKISFAVQDTGIGISAEQQERLFRPFSQADASTTRKYGGTGLGLALSRRLAEKLGGGIALESVPDQGSTFTLTIDSGADARPATGTAVVERSVQSLAQPQVPSLRGHVLVVDDGPDNQQLLGYYLRKCGLQVSSAENGERALVENNGKTFDLILMDMQMPVLDGYGATKSLRERGVKAPIIALTASILKESIKRCLEVGCNEHMSKPFKCEELFNLLARYLPAQQAAPVQASSNNASSNNGAVNTAATNEAFDAEYAAVIGNFRRRLPEKVREISAAEREHNRDDLKRLAHKLRAAGNFGLPDVSDVAAELEDAASESNWPRAEQLVARLEVVCSQIESGDGQAGVSECIKDNKLDQHAGSFSSLEVRGG